VKASSQSPKKSEKSKKAESPKKQMKKKAETSDTNAKKA
jgi:hypothetical protein